MDGDDGGHGKGLPCGQKDAVLMNKVGGRTHTRGGLPVGAFGFIQLSLLFDIVWTSAVDGALRDDVLTRPLAFECLTFSLEKVGECHGHLEGEICRVAIGVGGGAAGDVFEEVHPRWICWFYSCLNCDERGNLWELGCIMTGHAGTGGEVGRTVEAVAVA